MLDLMPTADSTIPAVSVSVPFLPSISTSQSPSALTFTAFTVVEVCTVARSLRNARSMVFDTSSSSRGIMRGMYSMIVTFTPSAA